MKNIDSEGHVTGKSVFLDDIPEIKGTLHAVVFASSVAHGKILRCDYSEAEAVIGVERIITCADIPGENQIGSVIPDEPLLAEHKVHYVGQPVAVILATSETAGRIAREKVKIEYEILPVITNPAEACEKGELLCPPRKFQLGDIEQAWEECDHIFESRAECGGQEHLYLETQSAYSLTTEDGNILVYSATQSPASVQKATARVLGIPMNRIEVDVRRLGGGFGGKEDQATAWAALSALSSFITRKPVKLILSRHDDLYMTGKRHPYMARFRIGLTKNFKINAYEVVFYQNGGASADLSPAILERTLFHTTGSYFVPNVKATAYSCRTNLPPNTAFRGFGAPQAMFVFESALAKAADKLGIPVQIIQERNLIKEHDEFPYGQKVTNDNTIQCWKKAVQRCDVEKRKIEIEHFNQSEPFLRKGLSLMPVCFGISFTTIFLNQARSLVHIYQDGSIGISTGAVEMGQGVNTRMIQVVAGALEVSPDRIRIETTNTTRVANASPTAASSGADLNGKALQNACDQLIIRLMQKASQLTGFEPGLLAVKDEMIWCDGKSTGLTWEKLIREAYLSRINLSQTGHYATSEIGFDKILEKGHPFAYYVSGTAVTEITLDCLRGRHRIDSVKIVHDFGKSMNDALDVSQLEGAVVQGIGWVTMEELRFTEKGRLLSDSLSTYKVPDIYSVPKIIESIPLETEGPELAILGSKAIGEPPFMYGIGVWFALKNAISAFNPDAIIRFEAPMTPEKILLSLYQTK
jgi:xanthine dehydrogenase large subunit